MAEEDSNTLFETAPSDVLAEFHVLEATLESVARAPVPVFADVCVVTALDRLGRPVSRASGDWDDPFMTSVFKDIGSYAGLFWSPLATWYVDPSTAESVLVPSVDETWILTHVADPAAYGLCMSIAPQSAIIVPLYCDETVQGVIMLWRTSAIRRYNVADLTFAEAVARRISAKISASFGELWCN